MSVLTILLAGDSGDGVQLIGQQLAMNIGNDVIATPEFPAEIRAPKNTHAGISGFKLGFNLEQVLYLEDKVDILVCFNMVAVEKYHSLMVDSGLIIVDENIFDKLSDAQKNLLKQIDAKHKLMQVPATELTLLAHEKSLLSVVEQKKTRNFFLLGLILWLLNKPIKLAQNFLRVKFEHSITLQQANLLALNTGYSFGETCDLQYEIAVSKASMNLSSIGHLTGNKALVAGMEIIEKIGQVKVFLSGYPITPASDIMQFALDRNLSVMQAEDEIAACGIALGASYGGRVGITCTSGPGLDLKMEMIGLAIAAELPLVIIDVQRAGPSTGMPTKSEQADLLQAIYGRHGESPCPVLAAVDSQDCLNLLIESTLIAIEHKTPVILLLDGKVANTMQNVSYITNSLENKIKSILGKKFSWVPGINPPKMLGGLNQDSAGNISYERLDHYNSLLKRQNKLESISKSLPKMLVDFIDNNSAEILLISFGSTYQLVQKVALMLKQKGYIVGTLCLKYLNPLPLDLLSISSKYKKIVVIELNLGQLQKLLSSHLKRDIVHIYPILDQKDTVDRILNEMLSLLANQEVICAT